MNKNRNLYYDFLKGLAIMGVVAIHTMIFNFESHSLGGVLLAAFRNLLGSCVPFFIAVSGYFLCNIEVNTKYAYISFMKKRLKVVYLPLLVWGLPWLLFHLRSAHNFLSAGYVLGMYFIGGLSILYFIVLIIELYAQLPLIQRANKNMVILLSLVSLVVTFGWSLINYATDIHPSLVLYCSFPTYIGYFALGCYIGKNKVSPNFWGALSIIIIGMILSVAESYYWLDYNPHNNWLGLKFSVQLLAFGVILLLFSKRLSGNYKSNKIKKNIEWLGTQSMPIYMTHMLVQFALTIIGLHPSLWITNWLTILTLDAIFIYILSKTLPRKVLPFIGIRH